MVRTTCARRGRKNSLPTTSRGEFYFRFVAFDERNSPSPNFCWSVSRARGCAPRERHKGAEPRNAPGAIGSAPPRLLFLERQTYEILRLAVEPIDSNKLLADTVRGSSATLPFLGSERAGKGTKKANTLGRPRRAIKLGDFSNIGPRRADETSRKFRRLLSPCSFRRPLRVYPAWVHAAASSRKPTPGSLS